VSCDGLMRDERELVLSVVTWLGTSLVVLQAYSA